MTCETNWMQQLWFINNQLAQHVSGITMPIFRSARPYITPHGFQHRKISENKVFALWPIVCCVRWWLVACIKCALGCVLCGVVWFVFLLWQVKVLSWEGAWCGGVVVLEMCVPWLEVASYIKPWFLFQSMWLISQNSFCVYWFAFTAMVPQWRGIGKIRIFKWKSSYPITALNRPLRLQKVKVTRISKQSAYESGKVVSPTHRPTLPQEIFLIFMSVRGWVNPRAIVRQEGLSKWKIPVTPSGNETATFWLVAQCLRS